MSQQEKDEKFDRNLRVISGIAGVLLTVATGLMRILEAEQELRQKRAQKPKTIKGRARTVKGPAKRKVGRLRGITFNYLITLGRKAKKLQLRVDKLEKKVQKERDKENGEAL